MNAQLLAGAFQKKDITLCPRKTSYCVFAIVICLESPALQHGHNRLKALAGNFNATSQMPNEKLVGHLQQILGFPPEKRGKLA